MIARGNASHTQLSLTDPVIDRFSVLTHHYTIIIFSAFTYFSTRYLGQYSKVRH